MRADRVLALLLLLQARGRLTAGELAARLEVSRRTVYRDVEALSSAGVPVRADPGPNGGIELVAGWRTDLTGLTAPEVEALFTSATGPAFERAMGKLAAALPGEGGRRAGRIRERLLVDSAGWGRPSPQAPPHLRMVQDAVFGDRRPRHQRCHTPRHAQCGNRPASSRRRRESNRHRSGTQGAGVL